MTFQVTYKDAKGSVLKESVEAESRIAVFARMSAKGLSPISIKQVGTRQASRNASAGGNIPLRVKIVACIAVVAASCGLFWFMSAKQSDGNASIEKSHRSADNRATHLPSRAVESSIESQITSGVDDLQPAAIIEAEDPGSVDTYNGIKVVDRTATTNDTGFVYEKIRTVDGKVHSITHFPKPIFHHATDELLSMAVGSNGAQLPPLPQLSEADDETFLASLNDPIVVSDEDDERTREAKLAVIAAREDMRMLVESGMTFREAIMEHHRLFNDGVEIRSEVMREVDAMVKEGDIEDAESYLASVNALLEQKGIQPVEMPAKVRLPANGGM